MVTDGMVELKTQLRFLCVHDARGLDWRKDNVDDALANCAFRKPNVLHKIPTTENRTPNAFVSRPYN